MKVYNLKILVEPSDDGGFFIECPALQGCYTSGKTIEEALRNIKEAIRAHIEDRIADGDLLPSELDLGETLETMVCVEV